ncbi:MAG: ATP-binding protein, partial [Treponema sp.]|nr:ATP-binding protein [Treponema sp.]
MSEVEKLEKQISKLPSGYVTHRTINNKTYYYLQGTKNGEQFSITISEKDAAEMKEKIELRKSLEKKLKTLSKSLPKAAVAVSDFNT